MAEKPITLHETEPGKFETDPNPESKVEPVKGKITVQKETFIDKVKKVVVNEDTKKVKKYIIYDVAIPAFKDLLVNAVVSGIQMIVYGEVSNNIRNRFSSGGISWTNYSGMFSSNSKSNHSQRISSPSSYDYGTKNVMSFRSLNFSNRDAAMFIVRDLKDWIDVYGNVSVARIYDRAIEIDPDFNVKSTDLETRYGWYNLKDPVGTYIYSKNGKWFLDLPAPIRLD